MLKLTINLSETYPRTIKVELLRIRSRKVIPKIKNRRYQIIQGFLQKPKFDVNRSTKALKKCLNIKLIRLCGLRHCRDGHKGNALGI